ncbi:hypothetical protein A5647_05050 [Mycobacterium sp. 1100029.7]|nr:hypothetical protein A5647_05050 [Mycobacterium sp. 1100029.7]
MAATHADIGGLGGSVSRVPRLDRLASLVVPVGAHRPSQVARAGRLTERRDGVIGELEATFGTERAPFCGTLF